ncbi:MAG: anti-sigma factor [Tardiphaga sp.]|uniref:anti-sigma factor family protein n=1 Tax=Tardiphaga sp. TaxID=1926292 RepID=UPI00260BB75C|nr:anti-sigma factor [Tardiphaga sp.]MDB5503450.1 anti-sigma factor [Tardiphaga sp.]
MTSRPITEEDLHSYVDGVLAPDRKDEVAAYLEAHRDVAARVTGYEKQRAALRAALAQIVVEPLPPELDLARMIARRGRSRQTPWWAAAAAAVVLLCVGGAGGWSLHGPLAPSEGVAAIAQEAAQNFAVYGSDRIHPVELRATDRAELIDWATQRLGRSVGVPDLAASGYRFMGGRIVATAHGPAAMFMYDDDRGTRLVVLARPMQADHNAPMTRHADGPVNGFAWADNGLGYSLVGQTAPETLHPIANEVRRQLSPQI